MADKVLVGSGETDKLKPLFLYPAWLSKMEAKAA